MHGFVRPGPPRPRNRTGHRRPGPTSPARGPATGDPTPYEFGNTTSYDPAA
ncbi:hypothetical protein [Streptomyces europaeiscabiei]|uniref:hypothetical protein n=1 Tax=Streptomyces europaeiscabiei TaxID=146819 RepID=UPI002E2DCEF8|nr:hypothetical protein [Streptomyces europaeiscabiei]